jgi:UDP:flavonoid glycosyltransferase YjiC (YdhE family)
VEYLGAGLRADPAHLQPPQVVDKVKRLLSDTSFRAGAERTAAVLGATDGIGTAVRFVERLIEARRPIHRPPGYPSTVTRDMAAPWEWSAGGSA